MNKCYLCDRSRPCFGKPPVCAECVRVHLDPPKRQQTKQEPPQPKETPPLWRNPYTRSSESLPSRP